MSKNADRLAGLVVPFGLSDEEARVYLVLVESGYLSVVEVGRKLKLPRTRVYRILDSLMEKQLVVRRLGSRGLKFGSNSPRQLELLLKEREKKIEALKESLPTIVGQLEMLGDRQRQQKSAVKYYQGVEGLKRVTYNSTQAKKGQLLIYEVVQDMGKFVDHEFAEEMRRELVKNRVFTRQLTNHKIIEPYTEVYEKVEKYWEVRYVDPARLPIKIETLVYDETVAMYSLEKGDVFCVEIGNARLAEMQRQIFEYIWSTARRMRVTDVGGGAEVMG